MAKQFKKFDITKQYKTKEVINTQSGEVRELPVGYRYGDITVFSDQPIPEDLSIAIEIPTEFLGGENQLNVWARKKPEGQN